MEGQAASPMANLESQTRWTPKRTSATPQNEFQTQAHKQTRVKRLVPPSAWPRGAPRRSPCRHRHLQLLPRSGETTCGTCHYCEPSLRSCWRCCGHRCPPPLHPRSHPQRSRFRRRRHRHRRCRRHRFDVGSSYCYRHPRVQTAAGRQGRQGPHACCGCCRWYFRRTVLPGPPPPPVAAMTDVVVAAAAAAAVDVVPALERHRSTFGCSRFACCCHW